MNVNSDGIVMKLLLLFLLLFGSIISPISIYSDSSKNTLSADDDFMIQNISSFIDESAIMHIYGEVRNTSDMSIANVTVNGSFYDDNGKLLNVYRRSCELPTVNAGSVCPFEILYIDTKTTNNINDFKLSALGIVTNNSKPTTLKFYSVNSRLDILGFYYINGRISNEGSVTATDSSVVATLYDKDGKVIAIGRALAEPINIVPGSQANFGIAVTEKSQAYKTERFSLTAYSTQYASSPSPIASK